MNRLAILAFAAALGLAAPVPSFGQAPSPPSSSASEATPAAPAQSAPHQHGHAAPAPATGQAPTADEHGPHRPAAPPPTLPPNVPPLTDADRAAAFPADLDGHKVHDRAIHSFILFDQLELSSSGDDTGGSWDNKGWVGGDLNRFWFRTEGDGTSDLGTAQAHLLYGRAIARWWDVVAGMRQDFRPGPAQTWAAIGLQGLAPYWFEVEATAYVGEGGRTHFRFEVEYELLLTNRAVLQPLVELEIYGKSDSARQLGAGLSSADAGLRLRYEFRRELAPYVGIVWSRKFFGTADFAAAANKEIGGPRLVFGLRLWR